METEHRETKAADPGRHDGAAAIHRLTVMAAASCPSWTRFFGSPALLWSRGDRPGCL